MLSERDRWVLAGIERDLTATSPILARRMSRASATRRTWALPAVTAALGLALAVGLLVLHLVGDAFLVLALLSWPLARRLWWQRPVTVSWRRWRDRRTGGRGTTSAGV